MAVLLRGEGANRERGCDDPERQPEAGRLETGGGVPEVSEVFRGYEKAWLALTCARGYPGALCAGEGLRLGGYLRGLA